MGAKDASWFFSRRASARNDSDRLTTKRVSCLGGRKHTTLPDCRECCNLQTGLAQPESTAGPQRLTVPCATAPGVRSAGEEADREWDHSWIRSAEQQAHEHNRSGCPLRPAREEGGTGDSRPRYKHHRAVDDKCGVITAVETTVADVEENSRTEALIDQHEENTGTAVDTLFP